MGLNVGSGAGAVLNVLGPSSSISKTRPRIYKFGPVEISIDNAHISFIAVYFRELDDQSEGIPDSLAWIHEVGATDVVALARDEGIELERDDLLSDDEQEVLRVRDSNVSIVIREGQLDSIQLA